MSTTTSYTAAMINRSDMMEPILKAAPGFIPTWNRFLAEWKDEKDDLPIYLALSELARHIAQLHDQGAETQLKEIFVIVEAWHAQGDTYVREAATIGLLEDLQNANVVGSSKPEQLVKYLGPESRKWWGKVDAFWNKSMSTSDE